MKRFYPVSNAA